MWLQLRGVLQCSIHQALLAAAAATFLVTGAAQAQTPEPEDRPTTGVPTARADRADDDELDLGWIGLVGLLGLAGLAGRRRDGYTTDRGPSVRTDRV